MSNNLRQIAKDLRSFVKRCKDVHYSDSLLITFLVTGLLTTFAPSIIRADVAEDQQEVSAQAYDTITDLRQSFLRAKKENQKALRGANAELAQLLKEGDQVVKSPWASFQFGTGYTNNDWGTSYKGRGGKKLEYYSRTNDLTKYVFDASKHQYGATNLNLPRNQEPNSLAITPANIHEPYRPYTPERLDSLVLPTAPTFDYNVPTSGNVATDFRLEVNPAAPYSPDGIYAEPAIARDVNVVNFNNRTTTYGTNAGNTTNASGVTNAAASGTTGTFDVQNHKLNNNRWWWWGSNQYWDTANPTTEISNGAFNIGNYSGTSYGPGWWTWWNWGGYSTYSGVDVNGANTNYWGTDDTVLGASGTYSTSTQAGREDYATIQYMTAHPGVDYATAHSIATGSNYLALKETPPGSGTWVWHFDVTGNVGTGGTPVPPTYTTYSALTANNVSASILANSNVSIKDNNFTVNNGGNSGTQNRNAIISSSTVATSGNIFTINGSEDNGILVKSGVLSSSNDLFNINGTQKNNGIILSGGKADVTSGAFKINSDKSNGINNQGGTNVDVTGGYFTVSANEANGLFSKSGKVVTKNVNSFSIGNVTKSTGIFADTGNTSVEDEGSTFTLGGNNNNAIYAKAGNVKTTGTNITIGGTTKNNGIFADTGTTKTEVNGPSSTITVSTGVTESNGIYVNAGTLDVDDVTFNVNVGRTGGAAYDKNAAIRLTTTGGVSNVNNARITVHGTDSAGIWADAKSDKLTVSNSNIVIGNGAPLATNQYRNNGIYRDNRPLDSLNTSYTINGTSSNGVYSKDGKDVTFNGGTMTINGSYNNGYIDRGTGTDKVQNMTFNVNGSHNNGIYATKDGATISEISGSTFNVTANNIGLLVGDTDGKAVITKIENSTFNVPNTNASSDNNGTAIYLHEGEITNFKNSKVSGITGGVVADKGNDILVTINTKKTNKIDHEQTVYEAAGNNNVVFNLQNGDTNDNTTITLGTTSGKAGADVVIHGDYNSVYKVNQFVNKVAIINGDKSSTGVLGTDNLATEAQVGNGRIYLKGNNNVIYDGLAYVPQGEITLGDAQLVGNSNAIVNLQGPRIKVDSNTGTIAPAGAFTGDIRIQGAIGGEARQYGANYSNNNVAIYAASGQNKNLGEGIISNKGGALKNVSVKDINVAFGSASKNGVLVYATNGTAVDVATTTTYKSGTGTVAAITDGGVGAGTAPQRGYDVDNVNYGDTSYRTIMGYGNGVFSDLGNYSLSAASAPKKQSTVAFTTAVDMVAKEGIAYYAKNGGKVTNTADTRAGGGQSIVAYADGYDTTGTIAGSAGNSTVETKNITAADYLILGDYTQRTPAERLKVYQNIGAYARNGGQVKIENATPEDKAVEQNVNKVDGKNATTLNGKSLVYGIGAFAEDRGSLIDIKGASGKGIHVVTGPNTGVYARKEGQVNFTGYITNQNNITTDGAAEIVTADYSNKTSNYVTTSGSTAVKRKGINNGSAGNDHEFSTPFYVSRTGGDQIANINFTGKTYIGMYDGILYTGNKYGYGIWSNNGNKPLSDYYKESDNDNTSEWAAAKYRGMKNVTTLISGNKSEHGGVNIGVINQPKEEIEWEGEQAGGDGSKGYLKGIGKDYHGMTITNVAGTATDQHGHDGKQWEIYSTVINGRMKVNQNVVIEDVAATKNTDSTVTAITGTNDFNDPFNDIAMESNLVSIESGKKVFGNAAYRDLGPNYAKNYQKNNVGLAMGNSLNRWDDLTLSATADNWRKTKNSESGITNKGVVDIWGGSESSGITGLLVNFGTLKNGNGTAAGLVRVDHGNALAGTDGSIIQNLANSEIIVTGKYDPANKGANVTRSADPKQSGENYGIVGISDGYVNYNTANNSGIGDDINLIKINHENAKIFVEGDKATGIYAENRNNATDSNVEIVYINDTSGSTGINVSNPNIDSTTSRGVGIALVNGSSTTYNNGATNAGGVIKLTGASNGALGTAALPTANATLPGSALPSTGTLDLKMGNNDILTGKNGVGIYAESADIQVLSDKFTVLTKDNGVGLWAMDDTHVAAGTTDKVFQYNYNGANDKNGFAMAFGGKNTNPNFTTASNYMDIKFSNKGDQTNQLNLVGEPSLAATNGTVKGIAGVLVNTNDAGDRVINKGKIEEDESSITNLKAYGAVVNKGTFENWGDIKLNESLMPTTADQVTTADMKKVNVGILANDHTANARYNTFIENHGDITIGDVADGANAANQDKNIGSWAIYGYNVKTGAKADGTDSVYRINKNSYGIYSGDGKVQIQKGTKIYVGNDTVLGHKQNTETIGTATFPIVRQNQYATDQQLLSGLDTPRERDSSIGVYIDNNGRFSNTDRDIEVSADMNIDRFSHGIVLAEKTGGAITNVTLGTSSADAPTIKLAYSTDDNKGGHVKSTTPHQPEPLSKEVYEQGNAVYYYSADTNSKATSYANVTMDGDYNTAYFTKGSVTNYGNIDLRSQYDLELRNNDPDHIPVGYGSVGIISENTTDPSINKGKIITGLSDTQNMMYSVGMGAGRNFYRVDPSTREKVYDRTEGQGYVINDGEIVVQEENGIGMLATGRGSKAINNGTIRLVGKNGVGMYIDREAIGENHGTITGDAENLKGVVAINGGYIKNYGTIKVEGTGSYGIVTDSSKFTLDVNGNPIAYHTDTSSAEYRNGTTAGQANGHGGTDLYGGTETSIEEGTTGNPKTTGVGTTITRPNIVPLTSVTIDGVEQPIFNFNNDADVAGKQAENILVTSSVQTVATGATELQIPIWLRARDEYGNPAWPRTNSPQTSEVTRIGMYVDTSGVRYTNPIDGIENLTRLGKVNLYFGPEITEYTNSKAIRIANNRREVAPGQYVVEENNILKPFNDALRRLPGGATINPLSSSLTWQVSANIDDNNQITELVMSKVPYHSFAFDGDKRLINFTNNLDNIYEIARPGSEEKMIFNKLNSIGNGEGHILAQAFDQMRGHIYGGIQQRTNATSNLLTDELAQLRSENNASKDSNKIKAFGRREEYKTDTAGLPDWHSNAGGFVYLHEDETVKLGDRSGWYAGVVNNYFTFKDLARSYENQAMLKTGIFKQTPLDEDGTFTFTIGGDAFFGKTNTKRRFWVVDKEFRAKSDYYTYGADINAKLEKEFRLTEGFSIVPNVGLDLQYGRFSTVNEDGDMALKIKSDDYYSVKPRAGVDFRYSQPVFKKSNFVASVGLAYETELGRLNDVDNEAKIKGAWTDYYTIKGDKEDRKGNFKSDLKLGLDNGRLGFTVNTGYDTKGHNFRAGLGLRALF